MNDKVLLIGDIHVSDKAPSSCTDSYTEDIIEMLKWTADYAQQNKISTVVWAGDVFHHKQPTRTSHALVLKMIRVVAYHIERGIDLYIVTGNHDISNDVLDSVHEKQPLGVLYEAGAKELNGWHSTLPVYGVPWQTGWVTDQETPMQAFDGWRSGKQSEYIDHSKALAVTHAPIYPPKEAQSILFELVPTSGAHGLGEAMGHTGYLYYGHIHEDHGVWTDDGVTYANMGALSRGSLHEYNIEREIKVCTWAPDEGFVTVPVPHKPASEVFLMAERMEEKQEKMSLDSFLSDIGTSSLDISSTESVAQHIRDRADIEPQIKKKAIEILEEVS